jgi:ankyrin repeat protein
MASQVDKDLIVAVGATDRGDDASNFEEIKSLLANGASGDFVFEDEPSIPGELEGYSALMVAARNGRRDVVELLLESGADPAVTGEDFYPQMGPVHCAAKSGHPACLALLLNAVCSSMILTEYRYCELSCTYIDMNMKRFLASYWGNIP